MIDAANMKRIRRRINRLVAEGKIKPAKPPSPYAPASTRRTSGT